jgi:membrane protein DedA with SNARE-associated domain
MSELTQFLIEHGYTVIFIWVALDQAGLPLPAIPLLLAAGALAGMGELSFPLIILSCVVASAPIDYFWFWLGRTHGGKVLNLLCSISLEPDYCVRDTESLFFKLGNLSLVISKFVPGLQTLAPPMAGIIGTQPLMFLVLDIIGCLIWALVFCGIGYWFHTEMLMLAERFSELGILAALVLVLALVAFFGYKLIRRMIFVRSLRTRRLEPEDVNEMLKSGDDIHILDLRHNHDFEQRPQMVPTATRVPMESIERHADHIPKDSNIVLYCN